MRSGVASAPRSLLVALSIVALCLEVGRGRKAVKVAETLVAKVVKAAGGIENASASQPGAARETGSNYTKHTAITGSVGAANVALTSGTVAKKPPRGGRGQKYLNVMNLIFAQLPKVLAIGAMDAAKAAPRAVYDYWYAADAVASATTGVDALMKLGLTAADATAKAGAVTGPVSGVAGAVQALQAGAELANHYDRMQACNVQTKTCTIVLGAAGAGLAVAACFVTMGGAALVGGAVLGIASVVTNQTEGTEYDMFCGWLERFISNCIDEKQRDDPSLSDADALDQCTKEAATQVATVVDNTVNQAQAKSDEEDVVDVQDESDVISISSASMRASISEEDDDVADLPFQHDAFSHSGRSAPGVPD